MSEYRQDRTSGAWVVIAPKLGRRLPLRGADGPDPSAAEDAGHCPFCSGNEHLLPPIIEQTSADAEPGWSTRVVPNSRPAVLPVGDARYLASDQQLRLAGFGYHETIIESPRHDADLDTLSDTDLTALVRIWQARFAELSARPGIEATFVFRDRGRDTAAWRWHPHSEIIATAIVPPWIAVKAGWARERFAADGRCATCEELAHEATDGQRVVETSRSFLVAVPFAARCPFELRVTPFRHQSSFADASPTEIADLGPLLRRVVARLQATLGGCNYHMVIGSAAAHGHDPRSDHWSLSIMPDTSRPGGFEFGSGLPLNPSRPEDDAAALRAAPIAGTP